MPKILFENLLKILLPLVTIPMSLAMPGVVLEFWTDLHGRLRYCHSCLPVAAANGWLMIELLGLLCKQYALFEHWNREVYAGQMVIPSIGSQAGHIAAPVGRPPQQMPGRWFNYWAFRVSNTPYLNIETVNLMEKSGVSFDCISGWLYCLYWFPVAAANGWPMI